MSGLLGATTRTDVTSLLLDGLRALSPSHAGPIGIAIHTGSDVETLSTMGGLPSFAHEVADRHWSGHTGLAQTGWGQPLAPNNLAAVPETADLVTVGLCGVIDNMMELRADLGLSTSPDAHEPVVARLIDRELKRGASPRSALRAAASFIDGAFSLIAVIHAFPDRLFALHRGRGLVIGKTEHGVAIASSSHSLRGLAREAIVLSEGDMVDIAVGQIDVRDSMGNAVTRRSVSLLPVLQSAPAPTLAHVRADIMASAGHAERAVSTFLRQDAFDGVMPVDWPSISHVRLLGSSSCHHAAHIARRWLQAFANVAVSVERTCDFADAPRVASRDGEIAFILSHTGEASDDVRCAEHLLAAGVPCFAISNAPTSTLAQRCIGHVDTLAGPEAGPVSTRSFTSLLLTMGAIAIHVARRRGMEATAADDLGDILRLTPTWIETALEADHEAGDLAAQLNDARVLLHVGRGNFGPLARESALKFKELARLPSIACPGGELRNGDAALIERGRPFLAFAANNPLLSTTVGDIRFATALGGKPVLIADRAALHVCGQMDSAHLVMPACPDFVQPIVAGVLVQLLGLHCATARGIDPARYLGKAAN